MQDPEYLKALHPLPVTVYAISLALSIAYQQLRYSRLSIDQNDARKDFNTASGILQTLRQKWEAADSLASLAHRISMALEKLPSLSLLRVDLAGMETENRLSDRFSRNNNDGLATQSHSQLRQPGDLDLGGHQDDPAAPSLDIEAMDLFGGMDDISWIYLDAENPISLESFSFSGFGG